MMTHLGDIGLRTGKCSIELPSASESSAIVALLRDTFESHSETDASLRVSALVPPADTKALREAIVKTAPSLALIAETALEALETTHCALIVADTGLAALGLGTRAAVLFALGVCMGRPTPTDQLDRRVVWDIQLRPPENSHGSASTFSEHNAEADLHTDTQYYAAPERYMLLYTVTQATCGGGLSMLRDLADLKEALSQSEDGRWALALLEQTPLPFRIPAVFTSDGGVNTLETTLAPIFGNHPGIRYRTDTLARGLEACPDHDSPDIRRALTILQAEIDRPEAMTTTLLPTDSLMFLNNHEALHGRTAFNDPDRHLWRVRIAEDPGLVTRNGCHQGKAA